MTEVNNGTIPMAAAAMRSRAPLDAGQIEYLRQMTPHSNRPYYSTDRWVSTVLSLADLLNDARGLLATFLCVEEYPSPEYDAALLTIDNITDAIGFPK